jgi:hypothetical protein
MMTARTQGSAYAIIAAEKGTRLDAREDRVPLTGDDANHTVDGLMCPSEWRNPAHRW